MSRRRVVVTGLGALSPLGLSVRETWEGLVAGRSGVATLTKFDTSGLDTHIGGELRGFDPEKRFPPQELKRIDPFTQYVLIAADEAMRDAGWDDARVDPDRAGVILGAGFGGMYAIEATHKKALSRGPSRVSPFFIPKMMENAISGNTSIRFGLRGPNFAVASACSSAANAMGLSMRTIQYGEADLMVTGGTEATTTLLGLAGFCALKALSRRNDEPEKASRPFDRDRDGFVMGEGAAVLVFEELEHARRRGAHIYAEVLGQGATADAHHITAPQEDGYGPSRAMTLALKDAGIPPESVDYVNAHGTSTPYNDIVETRAIKRTFGDHASRLWVSSTKSMIGHLLGASGAIGGMVSVLSIAHGIVHPTINLDTPDPDCDLDYVPHEAREKPIRAVLTNSLGFGGHNVTICFGAFGDRTA